MKKKIAVFLMLLCALMYCSCTSKYESLISDAEEALESGSYKEAIQLCDDAIELDADTADAYSVRGEAFQCKKKYQKAIKDYKKALSLGDESVYGKLGKAYQSVDDIDNAIKYMEKQIKYDDQDIDAYVELVNLYNENEMYKEARDTKARGYEKTGDEQLKVLSFTESEANELGGLFILSGERFYMLQPTGQESNSYNRNSYKYTDPDSEDIPVLCEGDKLVFFSPNDLEEEYELYNVDQSGYTFPVRFSKVDVYGGPSITGNEIEIPVYNESEQCMKVEKLSENFYVKNIENVNGMSYEDYYKANVIADSGIADAEKDEQIQFSYHKGSEYKEKVITASLKYYHMGDDISLSGSLTESSYGELDTSNLDSGTYIMPFELSKKTFMYFSNMVYYLFRVAK